MDKLGVIGAALLETFAESRVGIVALVLVGVCAVALCVSALQFVLMHNAFNNKLEKNKKTRVEISQLLLSPIRRRLRAKRFGDDFSLRKTYIRFTKKRRENRKYRWVQKETTKNRQGDGMVSIFAPSQKIASAPSFPKNKKRKTQPGVLAALRSTEILSWLPTDILQVLADTVKRVDLVAGQVLYSDRSDGYYVVVQGGNIKVVSSSSSSSSSSPFSSSSSSSSNNNNNNNVCSMEFGPGQAASGLVDLLGSICLVPCSPVARAVAQQATSVVCIDTACLSNLFGQFPGLQEEFLLRILIRLNRVTFMSLFRLTGTIMTLRDMLSGGDEDSSPCSPSSEEEKTDTLHLIAKELGVSPTELAENVEVLPYDDDEEEESSKEEKKGGKLPIYVMEEMKDFDVSSHPALYVVVEGTIKIMVGIKGNEGKSSVQQTLLPGECFGHLSLLTGMWNEWYRGTRSQVEQLWLSPQTNVRLAQVPSPTYNELLVRFPEIIGNKGKQVCTRISRVTRLFDLMTEWRRVGAGQALEGGEEEEEEEEGKKECIYVVLHGRLRAVTKSNQSFVAEHGRGSIIFEPFLSREQPSAMVASQTIRALRSSQLAAIPKAAVLELMHAYPQVAFHMGRSLSAPPSTMMVNVSKSLSSKSVVAVVPASRGVLVDNFCETLAAALGTMGADVTTLTSASVQRMADERQLGIGNVARDDPLPPLEHMILLTWLNEAEDASDLVFYVADPWTDPEPSWWSTVCIDQADLILLVGDGAAVDRGPTELELKLLQPFSNNNNNNNKKQQTTTWSTPCELVLVHFPEKTNKPHSLPTNTREWIVSRQGFLVEHHHHIRRHLDDPAFDVQHLKSDFRRLARWLLGESVGLVLGGGGARGLAHVSVLRCLEEAGVPVDFVAGTSIGAYVGALYAQTSDTLHMYQRLAVFCKAMSSVWAKLSDLTLPVTSYFSGSSFNQGIVQTFGDARIEDLWLPYFCITTDLTDSAELAHRNGTVWRYVRASMTLVQYIPPLCDAVQPVGGGKKELHYLADGGYLNNLPSDRLRELLGPKATVLAVDVQGKWKFAGTDYGDTLNGWKYLFMWLNPFVETPSIPTGADIQTQLAYITSVKQGSTAPQRRHQNAVPGGAYSQGGAVLETKPYQNLREITDLYLYPPVDDISTLDFHKSAEIQQRAYEYAKPKIIQWLDHLKRTDGSKYACIFPPKRGSNNNNNSSLHRRSQSWAKFQIAQHSQQEEDENTDDDDDDDDKKEERDHGKNGKNKTALNKQNTL